MQYKVVAFKCKVNSVVELSDEVIPAGAFYEQGDLYVVCLAPLEERKLPEEEEKIDKPAPTSEEQ